MAELPEIVDRPERGRTFALTRSVSLADAAPDGRMRFDGIARVLGDVASDDTDDADMSDEPWLVRRMALLVHAFPTSRERITMTTWGSGVGKRWAERRSSIIGDQGGHVEAAALWIHVDLETGRPAPWSDQFAATYLESAAGREVKSRLSLPKAPPEDPGEATMVNEMPWTFRQTDMDVYGHVNNAAYLAVLEEALGAGVPPTPLRIDIEWRRATVAGVALRAVEHVGPAGIHLWIMEGDDTVAVIGGGPVVD